MAKKKTMWKEVVKEKEEKYCAKRIVSDKGIVINTYENSDNFRYQSFLNMVGDLSYGYGATKAESLKDLKIKSNLLIQYLQQMIEGIDNALEDKTYDEV